MTSSIFSNNINIKEIKWYAAMLAMRNLNHKIYTIKYVITAGFYFTIMRAACLPYFLTLIKNEKETRIKKSFIWNAINNDTWTKQHIFCRRKTDG